MIKFRRKILHSLSLLLMCTILFVSPNNPITMHNDNCTKYDNIMPMHNKDQTASDMRPIK